MWEITEEEVAHSEELTEAIFRKYKIEEEDQDLLFIHLPLIILYDLQNEGKIKWLKPLDESKFGNA